MTLRDVISTLVCDASVAALASCAAASPLTDIRTMPPVVQHSGPYELQVLVDGVPAPTYSHNGGRYVLGRLHQRYTVRILNHTDRRIEAVVSVDGRDVVDGRPADFRTKRGYLVPARGQVDIDGWRLSDVQAAAFRFSTVADSYAGRTGFAREVGVIGAAIFPERYVPPPPPPRPLELPEPYAYGDVPHDKRSEAAPAPSAAPAADGESVGSGSAPQASRAPQNRSGLGTEFGEAVGSPVQEVPFVRANAGRPSAVVSLHYNDHDGLLALGIDVDGNRCTDGYGPYCDDEVALRETANPFPVVERRYATPPRGWQDGGAR
jgi:hypothetical protein